MVADVPQLPCAQRSFGACQTGLLLMLCVGVTLPSNPVLGSEPPTVLTDADLIELKQHVQLKRLELDDAKITDAELKHLAALVELRFLSLNRTPITDVGLTQLRGLTKLKSLFLSDTQITDAGLRHLTGLTQLRTLGVENSKIADDGLLHLRTLTELNWLYLDGTAVTDAGLTHLKGMKEGTQTGLLTGQSDVSNDVALGAGQIDYAPFLRAAKKAGVKWHFIEDESPSSERQIAESLQYLGRTKW